MNYWITDKEIDAFKARIAELEAALKPFVGGDPTMEHILFGNMPDKETATLKLPLGDLRRARAALKETVK